MAYLHGGASLTNVILHSLLESLVESILFEGNQRVSGFLGAANMELGQQLLRGVSDVVNLEGFSYIRALPTNPP